MNNSCRSLTARDCLNCAAALAAAKTAALPAATAPAAPAATAPAAAPVNSAAQHTAVTAAITSLNTAISQAGTVNSDLALATQSCKSAITWQTKAAATAPTT
jgi:hypothetical protein